MNRSTAARLPDTNGFARPCLTHNAAIGERMNLNRRDLLVGFGGLAASAGSAASRAAAPQGEVAQTEAPAGFPRKADFTIEEGYTYINAAYTHPIPKVSLEAVRQAAD